MNGPGAPPPPAAEQGVRQPLSAARAGTMSVVAHVVLLTTVVLTARLTTAPPQPPAYAVELVAAPRGPRDLGAVTQGPTIPDEKPPAAAPAPVPDASPTAPPAPAPAPRPKAVPQAKAPVPTPTPRPTAPAASPRASAAPSRPATPRSGGDVTVPGRTPAGGGETGGRGRDVASVKVTGTAFPYPGYLENITRQIARNFTPRPGVALKAEVSFLIHRDGSISDLRMISRSGLYAFDLECLGAVDAVGQRKLFGALPAGFRDDVLPVVFSFDPTLLR